MKINIGSLTGKKHTHKLGHNVTTTSQFGFCQPTLVREVNAQDTISLRVASSVMLQPLSSPTFGRLFVKQYNVFVPAEDIWHAYPSFLAAKSYHGSGSSYVPNQAPALPLWFLTWISHLCSSIYFYTGSFVAGTSGCTWSSAPTAVTTSSAVATALDDWILHLQAAFSGADYAKMTAIASEFKNRNYTVLPTSWSSSDFNIEMADWYYMFTTTANLKYLVCGRFTDRGKNMRKILIGSGYQLIYSADLKNLMPLWAYYKSWYDLFAIQRTSTWKDTPLFHIMETFEQIGGTFWYLTMNSFTQYDIADIVASLSECYYTQNPDYASAHISGTGVGRTLGSFNYVRPGINSGVPDTSTVAGTVNSGQYYNVQPGLSPSNNQTALDVLKKLYERVNINTAVGGKIKDYMRAIFGSDYKQEEESNFIGSTSMTIDISRVMSTAQTTVGELGEYAGKGDGSSVGDTFKFTARRSGYIVSFFAIVPDARLAQAVDPLVNHVNRFDFFDSKFDSITLLPTKKQNIFGCFDINTPIASLDQVAFGNIPNYMEYKIAYDKVNGDINMNSTKASLLPFTMAKLLPYTVVDGSASGKIQTVQPTQIVEGQMWRYIGLYRWLGNFDRIFQNEGVFQAPSSTSTGDLDNPDRLDDNFICYFYNDLTITGPELPVADSFQTDPFGAHDSVDKA